MSKSPIMIELSRVIPAPRAEVFNFTQDYSKRRLWDRCVKRTQWLSPHTAPEAQAKVRCVLRFGIVVDSEYVSFQPPKRAAVSMIRGPWFIRSIAGSWDFDAIVADATKVTFRYSVELQPRLIAGILRLVVRRLIEKESNRRLSDLKEYFLRLNMDPGRR